MPEGYKFVREELKEGTYDESSLIHSGDTDAVIHRVLARDENDEQEFDPKTVGRIKKGIDAESHVYNGPRIEPVTMTVNKVIAGTTTPLLGAKFKLTKVKDKNGNLPDNENDRYSQEIE